MDQNTALRPLATAGDIMTPGVVVIGPDASVTDAARLLLDNQIGAVPVVDGAGALVGMASDGDLLGRKTDQLAKQAWWLALLAQPGQAEVAMIEVAASRRVRDVMHGPVVTVIEHAPVQEVAALMRKHAIKRVPVLSAGGVIGIVTRADLLRVVEGTAEPGHAGASGGGLASIIGALVRGMGAGAAGSGSAKGAAERAAAEPLSAATADSFRHLVQESDQVKVDERGTAAHAAELARLEQVKTMLHDHMGEEMWTSLVAHARAAAAHGAKEMQMLQFPSDLCSDNGRRINNGDPAWSETLRGEAAEMYARFERELKPVGFGLAARVLDFPDGMPGNIGLFLIWLN